MNTPESEARNPEVSGTSLNAARRERDLAELPGEVVDVLVVGLGATGAGAALDAASRGLSVAAIDAHDLAFGTSRWSSKLIHGGLRYLGSGQVDVAYESAVERGVLMRRTAPHLVRALPFVMPMTPAVPRSGALAVAAAVRAGDVLRLSARTPRSVLPGPRRLSAVETLRLAPPLRPYGLRGGLLSWDGQLTDDARLVTALARTAAGLGARVLTRCRAVALTGDGAQVRDELTGREFGVRARSVVNAAGVWAGGLVDGVRLRPSRGTHIVVGADTLRGLTAGMQIPVPGSTSRFLLVLPQGDGRVYVGLTDVAADGPIPDVPEPTESEIGFLLDILGSALDVPVRRADVIGAYAGLRPLLDLGRGGDTADISRRHAVLTSPGGVVTIVGGKLTTYRRMAQDAVDAAARAAGLDAPPSRTARLPLVGAATRDRLDVLDAPSRLVQRYGTEAPLLTALAAEDPTLLEPVVPGLPVLGAELAWAVRHEGALEVGDLLDRRTRIGLVAPDRAAALPAAEALLPRAALR
ncbi:glycerol-3-phosphate dehydrogenase/oxidase [Actinomadura sp. 7K534]|uniref:glycerol-3-phosphate dehydrogenase/oxidase n=1 Tax=Actinomadura sp. 7K534 TaxID=2530366 RepID=UPI00104A3768|nr:glycerol-3-phosphate dehydrogenase/oxidase [Actinomadura sp. 7K534]TDB92312.1 glycerol-3-phosphate dehydrogenase/oxidase [Actinomadura sp. 7K534]